MLWCSPSAPVSYDHRRALPYSARPDFARIGISTFFRDGHTDRHTLLFQISHAIHQARLPGWMADIDLHFRVWPSAAC